MIHNYYFVTFFFIANTFLLNVLIGFIIDNIVSLLSEEITDDGVQNEDQENDEVKLQREQELQKGVFGKFYSLYTGTKKITGNITGNIKSIGIGLLNTVNETISTDTGKPKDEAKPPNS